jgi:aminobenzoyl-glutamate utilization protein B
MSRPSPFRSRTLLSGLAGALTLVCAASASAAQRPAAQAGSGAASNLPSSARAEGYKREVAASVDDMAKLAQEMVDSVFSFSELGHQEVETSRYLTETLEKRGFTVRRGVAGMPTAWVATWGSGKPVIAMGSDIDGIPQASQKPGVPYRSPLVAGAPGHGEGHNSGMPLNVVAALAVKAIMERDALPGTLMLWPGVAEELLAAKAWFVREGLFKDVDIALFAHVDSNFRTGWGSGGGNGLVSVEYTFDGESAHSANAPWRGRSALDAVELMNAGWNFKREHLRIQQRSHYVITDGGDQPNVVPSKATVWYFFRETEYPRIKEMWDLGNTMAAGAALMTSTTWTSRVLGAAWPQHFNKPVAEAMSANIARVGMPRWSDDDQAFAKAVQRSIAAPNQNGLDAQLGAMEGPIRDEDKRGGGSDDIGDVSWTVPTITLRYPSNIPGLPGHNWANAIAMATPIAHKGVVAGAKAQAMTVVDLLTRPELIASAWEYFRTVQTKDTTYVPFIAAETLPPTWLNKDTLDRYRPDLRKFYYDPAKYTTYLEQLGVTYPTLAQPAPRP